MINQSIVRGISAASRTSGMTMRRQAVMSVNRQLGAKRMASSTNPIKKVQSDAPWAITSLLVFGGLFVYLTAPTSGDKHGHGHDDKGHGKEVETEEEPAEEEPAEEEESEDASSSGDEYVDVKKIEDKPGDDAPKGSKALAERSLSADEGAHLQKKTKEASDIQRRDDTTFKHGVAAAKEGHADPEKRESNPKKVVAAAHTARQEKDAAKKEASESDDSE
ncbi:uncharacterized protein FA14DRAFT_180646 [Meira miltonrushii]|uniref:Uncharacterized protein n=1 Tax=Meira miltonrushii TaxID=1280837 RepID=A0A316VCR1_9BASI|nr:uncharacterized protein FA14DRAFT_180646 [Meira miltonrushii]PWN34013.1 hypothetical protein FA14DRAFT_180646 [Meira miltonrushii]